MSAQVASQQLPVGFGRGRRTNRMLVLSPGRWIPPGPDIPPLGPGVELDEWTGAVAATLLGATNQLGFALAWRFWRGDEPPADYFRAALSEAFDAAILLIPGEDLVPLSTSLRELDIPFVFAFARSPEADVSWVACDNSGGIAGAVQHLANLGHHCIAFLGGPPEIPDFAEREQGYLRGLTAAGLGFEPSLIIRASEDERDSSPLVKALAFPLLRRRNRPTAFVCATDLLARLLIDAAWESGLSVPQDLAVTGFDDGEHAINMVPLLTTIRQPVIAVAATACYLAACAVVGQRPAAGSWQVEIPVDFIVRESCAAAPSGRPRAGSPPQFLSQDRVMQQRLQSRVHQLSLVNEELAQLLSVVSHDLRAPLVTIAGFAGVLEQKNAAALGEHGRRHLARIRDTVDNMARLIEDTLAVSRSHSRPLNLTHFSTAELVNSVLRDLEGLIAKANARLLIGPDLPTITADRDALQRIFLNLITNALKYLDDQTTPEVRIGYARRPDEHEFFVQDNGIGIPPEYHQRIFQLFWRAPDARADGAGVGLSAVKALVLRHGGRIWVESEPAKGATFRFTLPRKESRHVSHPDPLPETP